MFKEDLFTSIKIECIECRILTTKEGDEEVTRKVPGVNEEFLSFLDRDGIVSIGTYVEEGDILVGKITPKPKTEKNSDEEKFFSILFGSDVSNFKNSSLKLDYGKEGVVFDIQRIKVGKNDNIDNECIELIKIYIAQKRKIQVGDKLVGRHGNKGCVSIVAPIEDMPFTSDGMPVDICLNVCGVPSRMNLGQIYETHLGLALKQQTVKIFYDLIVKNNIEEISGKFGIQNHVAKQLVIAGKKYIDGYKLTSLDIVDISIICRNTGLTFDDLNLKVSSPSFIGANRKDIIEEFIEADIKPEDMGKVVLYDGKTGNAFDNPVTVGTIYILKLNHMIDDKIHARSVGSYSKITQQPLGGKRQNGGQRVGEMEV
jgi:DNA-directed RNA polymerase subunit beta